MKDINGIEYSIDEFINQFDNNKSVVIFGGGKYGQYIFNYLQKANIPIDSIIDNDEVVLDRLSKSYPTKKIREIESLLDCSYFVIGISRINIIKIVQKQLTNMKVKTDQLIIPLPHEDSSFFDPMIMLDNEFCHKAVIEQWNFIRSLNDNHIIDYFETNDLYKIVIFEEEHVKGWLSNDLKDSKVNILKEYNLLEEFDANISCDAIVIGDELIYETMEEKLMEITDAPIISIWDILRN